jgi:hypothetical protein
MANTFLRAEWRKLILANYAVEPALLLPYLPAGTELDFWENTCYVSMVGFLFLNTRVLGIPIPFHRDFEEVNLRFYVRRFDGDQWRRGVVFIKEIVPRHAITLVANTLYGEHYATMPMRHQWLAETDSQNITYAWKQNQWHELSVKAGLRAHAIEVGSEAEFITEHYWGYTKHRNKTSEYEVTHPRWEVYPVISSRISIDFGQLYGPDFTFLNQERPKSVMLAEGSAIEVKMKGALDRPF